jgi:hypothetical protein
MAEENKTEEAKHVNGASTADELVIKLGKPVIAHGDEINELRFREPTAADIEACGSPVTIDFLNQSEPKMIYETKAMFAMMSRLAAVPPSTIKSMRTKDWEYAALALAHRFFIPEI